MVDYVAVLLSLGESAGLLKALFSFGEPSTPKLLKPEIDLYVAILFGIVQFILNWGIRLLIVTVRSLMLHSYHTAEY
jgi:hypothetical protein